MTEQRSCTEALDDLIVLARLSLLMSDKRLPPLEQKLLALIERARATLKVATELAFLCITHQNSSDLTPAP